MRVSSVLCCLILLGAGLGAEDAPSDQAAKVLQRLLEAQRAVTTMSGRFVQTTVRADDPEGGGTEYHGHVDLQAPAQYNLVYSNPKDDEWRLRHCSDGVTRWQIEQLFTDQPAEVSARPVVADGGGGGGGGDGGGRGSSDLVGRIAALLRGDRAAVLADFTVQATALGEGFKLVLTPKPGPLTEQLVMVEAELDAAGHVQVLRFFDRQGNRITITVSEAVYNQPLPPETFTYPAP